MDTPPKVENNPSPSGGFVKKTLPGERVTASLTAAAGLRPLSETMPEKKNFYAANKPYFWAIGLGVLIIGALSFFAFRDQAVPDPTEADVSIKIDVPETVPNGGNAVYRIQLQNNDDNKLIGIQLELTYPEGFSYTSSTPKPINLSGTLFKIPDLIPGQNVAVIVQAHVTGNINDTKSLVAKLHYKYSNFNSEFIKEQQSTVRLVASDVLLELNGPATTNNSQLVAYTIKYQNNSDQEIKNARVTFKAPDNFNMDSAMPEPDSNQGAWNILSLPVNASGEIQIQGSFKSASPGESRTALAEFLVLGQDGEYLTQNQSTFVTSIANLPLLVSQELVSQNTGGTVNPGDVLTFSLRYQNNAGTAATAVNILLTLDSKALDLSTLTADGAQVNNNTILWNASSVPNLESLAPSESGNLRFSVRVKNPATRDSSKNLTITSSAKIKSNEYESYFPGEEVSLKVSSPAILSTSLGFVEGSLPPKVGQSTTYKITLSLSNSSNDYSDGVLSAFIPLGPNGFVAGSVKSSEAGKVEFDPTTGKLTWRFGSLPAHTGKFTTPKVLDFNVKLVPSSGQVNQGPLLLKSIQLEARDIFTSQQITLSADDINTTDLPNGGFSNGQVQP